MSVVLRRGGEFTHLLARRQNIGPKDSALLYSETIHVGHFKVSSLSTTLKIFFV